MKHRHAASALILGAGLALAAQDQGLNVKLMDGPQPGSRAAEVTNPRQSAATAYEVRIELVEGGSPVRTLNGVPVEAVPQVGKPLEPGQARTFGAGWHAGLAPANSARIVCSIFADGFTAGDPDCVKLFLDKRRQLLREDIPQVAGILKTAQTQHAPDLPAIVAQMDKVIKDRQAWAGTQKPFSPLRAEARAHSLVSTNLVHGAATVGPQQEFKILLGFLEKWRVELEASLPKLAP